MFSITNDAKDYIKQQIMKARQQEEYFLDTQGKHLEYHIEEERFNSIFKKKESTMAKVRVNQDMIAEYDYGVEVVRNGRRFYNDYERAMKYNCGKRLDNPDNWVDKPVVEEIDTNKELLAEWDKALAEAQGGSHGEGI